MDILHESQFQIDPVCLVVGVLVFGPMLVEASVAARHERQLMSRGGIEATGDVYRVMQWAYPGTFIAMLGECLYRGHGDGLGRLLLIGVMVFAAGKALKWWAMATLGDFWTFRVIVVPGSESVVSGPYRFLDHPNYVGVVGELIGAALMTHAVVTGPLGTVLFAVLMLRRVAVEARARDAILRRR